MLAAVTIKRVTISLPEDLADKLREQAGDRSVSAYVADLISDHLDNDELEALWRGFVDDVGPSDTDIAAADRVLDELTAARSAGAA
jgi:hypothetical protein